MDNIWFPNVTTCFQLLTVFIIQYSKVDRKKLDFSTYVYGVVWYVVWYGRLISLQSQGLGFRHWCLVKSSLVDGVYYNSHEGAIMSNTLRHQQDSKQKSR